MKAFSFVFMLLTALLVNRLWFGQNSVPEYLRLKEKIGIQTQINAQLESRNQALQVEIQDLKEGFEAIEERARHDLGFIKPNEVFYRVLTQKELKYHPYP